MKMMTPMLEKGLQAMITFRNSRCSSCNKAIADEMLFCNQCQSSKAAYLDIFLPTIWTRYVASRKTDTDKIKEVLKFAERHGHRFDLVRLKLLCKFSIKVEVGKQDMRLLPEFSGDEHESTN